MSVVNKMLQDLEGRQKAQSINADYVPPNSSRTKQLLLSLLIVGLAASTLTLGIQQFTVNSDDANQRPANTEEPAYQPQQGDLLANAVSTDTESHNEQEDIKAQSELSSVQQQSASLKSESRFQDTVNTNASEIKNTEHEQMLTEDSVTQSAPKSELINVVDVKTENRLDIKASSGISHQASEMRARAYMALENRQPQQAISILQSAIKLDANDVQARKQLASLLFSEKQIAHAFNTLQVGLTDFPEDSSMRLMQARIAFKQGDKSLAMNILKAHPNASIASADFMSFRAALAEKNGEYKQAYSDYTILVNREPQNAKWWLGLAVSQDKLLMQDEAVSSYLQVRELNQLPHQVHSFVEERLQLLTRRS